MYLLKECLDINNESKRKRPIENVNSESLKASRSQFGDLIRLEHIWIVDNFSLLPQQTGDFIGWYIVLMNSKIWFIT